MDWKPKDWIEHSKFGIGQVGEDRGDKLDIQFINSGAKTILKTTELKPATEPPDFKFPADKRKSRSPKFKVEPPARRPALDFDHLVTCFKRRFPDGFEGKDFHDKERGYKEKARDVLKDKLGKDAFENLLREGHYAEVCEIAKHVLQSTNLAHYIEKAKFVDGKNVAYQERFAKALYNVLHGSAEMEQRFTKFCDLLSEMGANKWTIATYYQFLDTDGEWMFMKPSIMKRMAVSLKISLNYKPEPNWKTYSKLQELADCVEKELSDRVKPEMQNRGLKPRSRIDVQGFVWASIQIADGTYGKKGLSTGIRRARV
jgi:hypothetical protein